ncbi:leucine-rich repeat-containing protein kinase family protein [Pseudomonas sp. R5(2019)]|uniref:leucine-rich repeat-containing protein kinase family protein n=1 Tax=Pseudomonas sp. R5(2019) TaxID=2697566 RepID=UPI001411FE4C|nr:leucine-rich repeat-containing protein kinase family protein [Pseudomonas sp. R5(2019)]NBA95960.1 protein kinase [Pseudomonas sp. R5(2019)]
MHTLDDLKAGRLAGSTRLDLACGLEHFPEEIFSLADTLQVLNLSGNSLRSLPDDLGRLKHLRVLFCSYNPFTELPASLGQCPTLQVVGFRGCQIERVPASALAPRLRSLVLTDNRIETLPEQLGDCVELQKLMLSGNRLTALPDSLARCQQLELLRLAANRLSALPLWLLQMPNLAWLAFAGNPLPDGFQPPPEPDRATIDWQHLTLHHTLGEGASGVIHQAFRQPQQCEVAVKLYKGNITSDGLPHHEMSASLIAGKHPHLIGVQGRVSGHPQGLAGLVMDLIDPQLGNLAGPPSLESCTRDIYPERARFTPVAVRRLACAIASAAEHLHSLGINHGDLYAHNVLCTEQGQALLGDFGAAAFYPQAAGTMAQALQRIEVRAFGILLGELLERGDDSDPAMEALQQSCLLAQVMQRPSFAEIHRRLQPV